MLPKWAQFVKSRYKSNISNAFLLTGNIGDYAAGRKYMKDYLIGNFFREEEGIPMDRIIYYDMYSQAVCVYGDNKGQQMSWDGMISDMKKGKGSARTAYLLFYPGFILPPGDFLQVEDKKSILSLHAVLNSSQFVNSADIVIFVTDTAKDINSLFLGNNSKLSVYNIELPDREDRRCFISTIARTESSIRLGISIDELANLTAGLQLIAIEDILLYGAAEGSVTARMVMDRKKEVIQKEFGEVIEIFETEGYSLKDFAGQEDIKQYFKEVVIDAIRKNDVEIIPKGVMLMGPPGTGKTYFARCLAGDAGINFVEFKMSKILGKYVGESEKSMEKALSVFRALAPVGVFMDEIDQSMRRGDGDTNGVASNLFGMLLSEMSKPENRGKIVWLAATNYPNKVDEALKRAGRFDKKIPFFAPTEKEREYVFNLHINKAVKKGFRTSGNLNVAELAKKTNKYTQAEIEAVVVKALELARRRKNAKGGSLELTQSDLLKALEYMLSAQNFKITEMEDIALKECNDQEFIPEEYKSRHRQLMSDATGQYGEVNRMNTGR